VPALEPYIIEPIWEQFQALLPEREIDHPLGYHKPRIPDRLVFEKLVQILVFDSAYWRIAEESCSESTLRRRREEESMVNVTVVFTNGTLVSFAGQEFDADLVNTYGESAVKKFPYKDAKGQDSAIQLRPKDVVGVFVTPAPSLDPDEEMPSL
jgi:hypothetical protein